MHLESLWLMLLFGLTSLALLVFGGVAKAKRQRRLRNLILKRLE